MAQNAATITGSQREDALLRLNDAEWHLSRLREVVEAGGLDGDTAGEELAGLGGWVLDLLDLDGKPTAEACAAARRRLVVALSRAASAPSPAESSDSIDGDDDYAYLLSRELDAEDEELSPEPVRLAP